MKYKDAIKPLSEREYYDFVFNRYEPSLYESHDLTRQGVSYSHLSRTRSFLIYREIVNRLSVDSKIADFGFFPGTIVRQLGSLLGGKIRCYGIGQKVDEKFESFIRPYVEECVNLELDPFYAKGDATIRIPFADGFFDAVVATEILEHLISPVEMISEGARILKPGGLFIITTPNVSHIGAVLKLILGRSNYESLDRSPMYMQNDTWRGHNRLYDKQELRLLFQRSGLELLSHRYYRELGWTHIKHPLLKRIIMTIVDKCAPIYREEHLAVFQK